MLNPASMQCKVWRNQVAAMSILDTGVFYNMDVCLRLNMDVCQWLNMDACGYRYLEAGVALNVW